MVVAVKKSTISELTLNQQYVNDILSQNDFYPDKIHLPLIIKVLLDVSTHFYRRVCRSVGPSVH